MKLKFLIGTFLVLNLVTKSQQLPKRTLFVSPDLTVEEFKKRYNVNISQTFATCMDSQLTDAFIRLTGIKPGINVSISNANEEKFFYRLIPYLVFLF
jgi:hypothetical protein